MTITRGSAPRLYSGGGMRKKHDRNNVKVSVSVPVKGKKGDNRKIPGNNGRPASQTAKG